MKYTQEQQNQILGRINAGVIGKRKQVAWDRVARNVKWTKEKVIEEVNKYTRYEDFQKQSHSAYKHARYYGFLDEVTSHLGRDRKDSYDIETVKKLAKKYKTRTKFQKSKDGAAWHWAMRNKKLDEVCNHMPKFRRNLTKEEIIEIAKPCKHAYALSKIDSGAHRVAYKNGWLKEIFPKK